MKYLLLLLTWSLAPLALHAQFGPLGPRAGEGNAPGFLQYDGSEIYRFLLHKQGLEPLNGIQEAFDNPSDTIIVIHGDVPELRDLHNFTGQRLRDFLLGGGAVLIAGDETIDRRPGAWANTFGVERNGRHLTADNDTCYRQTPGRPYVRPLNPFAPALLRANSPFRIVAGIERTGKTAIATDLASAMYFTERPPFGFSRYDLGSYPIVTEYLGPLPPGQPKLKLEGCYFASAFMANDGTGRMLVMADHSVFVNGMMGFVKDGDSYTTDNGNFEFARRSISWLQESNPNKRTKCVFIEDGFVVNRFATKIQNFPNQKPPLPPLTPEMAVALGNVALNYTNRVIEKTEETDFFNRVLNRMGQERLLRNFLVVVTILAGFALFRRLLRGYWTTIPSAAPHPTVQETLLPRGSVMKQRVEAQIDVNNFYEAARTRIRDRFNRLGGQPTPDGTMPPVLLANDASDLSQTIRGLWLIGYGPKPIHIGPGEWDAMNQDLERAMKRAARGEWTFGQEIV